MTLRDEEPLQEAGGPRVDLLVLVGDLEGIWRIRPEAGESLLITCDEGIHPGARVRKWVEDQGLVPCFLHSTSWRFVDGEVLLTYVAVVEIPRHLPDGYVCEGIVPAPFSRWGPIDPPGDISTQDVVSHTLRHLAWLVQEDEGAREVLRGWDPFLAGQKPEPFRAFDEISGPH